MMNEWVVPPATHYTLSAPKNGEPVHRTGDQSRQPCQGWGEGCNLGQPQIFLRVDQMPRSLADGIDPLAPDAWLPAQLAGDSGTS